MNELVQSHYPFVFFNEEAFSKEWILNELQTGYMKLLEYREDNPALLNTGYIQSKGPDLFKLGMIGRICTLGEDYITIGCDREINEEIRLVYQQMDCDLIQTVEYIEKSEVHIFGFMGMPMDREHMNLFERDIATALNLSHLFFLDSKIDYEGLHWLHRNYEQDTPSPFSKEGIERVFRNIPTVRIW